MSRANDFLGWFILALAVIAPVPFGSNPPIFWAISGFCVGLSTLFYLLYCRWLQTPLRVPFRKLWLLISLWLALCLWLVVQAVPLGKLLGEFDFLSSEGIVITAETLSLAPGSTWLMLIRMLSYGLLFFLAVQAGAKQARAERLLQILFWAVVAHAAFGLVQLTQLGDTILGFDKKYYQGVATGTFVNRNSYATFLAMGLALGTALFSAMLFSPRLRHERASDTAFRMAVLLGGIFVVTVALLATQSRMGLFAGGLGLLVGVLITLRWMPYAAVSVPVAVVISALVAVGVVWVFGQGVLERGIDLAESTRGRGVLYEQVIELISQRPLLGYGGGAFELAYPLYFGPPLPLDLLFDKAHSTYLTLAAELGILAGVIPVLLVGLLFWRVLLRSLQRTDVRLSSMAAVGVIIVAATHSTVDFSLEMQANAYFLVVVMGLAYATGGSRASATKGE